MATSLLRLGRRGALKCLKLENWHVMRGSLAVSLCTDETTKPTTKTKAASKTAEAPDERTALLANKTTVAFPVRFSEPRLFPTQSLGVAEQVTSSTVTPEALVAAAATIPFTVASEQAEAVPQPRGTPAASSPVLQVNPETLPPLPHDVSAAEPDAANKTTAPHNTTVEVSTTHDKVLPTTSLSGDPSVDSSSSSSSESDSDSESESDSDDEKSEVKTKVKTSPTEVAQSTMTEEAELPVTSEVKEGTDKDTKEVLLETEDCLSNGAVEDIVPAAEVEIVKAAQATMVKPRSNFVDTATESLDLNADLAVAAGESAANHSTTVKINKMSNEMRVPAPIIAEAAGPDLQEEARVEPSEDIVPAAEVEIVEAAQATAVKPKSSFVDTSTEPLDVSADLAVAAGESAANFSTTVKISKEMSVPAPIIAEAAGPDLQEEARVEPSEETAAVAPPEPEEPFDNSTYKNYEHHSYTPFTFADLDVEMAKFRLPQPSSGRH